MTDKNDSSLAEECSDVRAAFRPLSEERLFEIGPGRRGPSKQECASMADEIMRSRRLIAAAPDLLRAVAAFVERFDGGEGRRADTDHVAALMRSSYAKATGAPPTARLTPKAEGR